MAKWYRVDYSTDISEHEVVSSTPHTLTFLEKSWRGNAMTERKTVKISSGHRWFENRDEAVSYIRDHLMRRIDSTQQSLDKLKRQLRDLK